MISPLGSGNRKIASPVSFLCITQLSHTYRITALFYNLAGSTTSSNSEQQACGSELSFIQCFMFLTLPVLPSSHYEQVLTSDALPAVPFIYVKYGVESTIISLSNAQGNSWTSLSTAMDHVLVLKLFFPLSCTCFHLPIPIFKIQCRKLDYTC